MKHSVSPFLGVAVALTLLSLSPRAVSPAHAFVPEIHLNSSNVQVVHNPSPSTDVLNLSLNVTSDGELGGCEGEDDDLLESGVTVGVFGGSCTEYFYFCIFFSCPTQPFDYTVNPYVEHEIGSTSYGTFFGSNGAGSVSSKIVSLATPINTCGTWNINLQATALDLSSITSSPISLFLNDSDDSGPFCYDVSANIGNGVVKPHHGVRKARRH